MKKQITVEPTKGFLVPPVGKDFTARIKRVDEKGSHSMAVYGPTKEIALAKLMVEVDRRSVQFDGGVEIVDDDGMLRDLDPTNRLLSEEKEYRPNRFEPTAEDLLAGCGLLILLIVGFAIGQEFVR